MSRSYLSGKRFHEAIALSAVSLAIGEQTRDVPCPSCNGGRTNEKSFAILKDQGVIKYRCWRSSCGIHGALSFNGSLIADDTEKKEEKPRALMAQFAPFPDFGLNLFSEKFGITKDDLSYAEVRYIQETDRYAFGMRGPSYDRRGWNVRSFNQNSGLPKWDAYPAIKGITWVGWNIQTHLVHANRPVVVVEDPISAIKVGRQFMCASINGTSLDFDKASEIMRVGKHNGVVFALDQDATSKAIDLLGKWSFFLGGIAKAVPIKRDLKYETNEEIHNIILQKG